MKEYLPYLFPVFFVLLWLFVTTLLSYFSGWFALMRKYPDRPEKELLQLKNQSGYMGPGVSMRHILHLGVCPSGLRLGMMGIFGPFSKNFFVPWEEISVKRKKWLFFWKMTELQFGNPLAGKLGIHEHVANRLARTASEKWPEAVDAAPPKK